MKRLPPIVTYLSLALNAACLIAAAVAYVMVRRALGGCIVLAALLTLVGCASKPAGVSQRAFSQTQLMPAADGTHETWIWWADGSMTSVKWGKE